MNTVNKKIIFFTENYERGGGNKYLYDLVSIACKSGHEIILYSNQFGLEDAEKLWFQSLGVNYKTIPIFSWGELRTKFKLRKYFFLKVLCRLAYIPNLIFILTYQFFSFLILLVKEKPELIVGANGGYPAGGAVNRFILASSILRIPSYYSIVSIPSKSFQDKFRMIFWDRILPEIVSKVIVNSAAIKTNLLNHRFNDNKIIVIHNGLEGTTTYKERRNRKVKILFFARIEEAKGIPNLIRSMHILNSDLKNQIEFHFYGSGQLSGKIEELSKSSNSNIFYHGFFEGDSQNIYRQCDIFVLPSIIEGLPYSVIEAMKSGCCIVASSVGGLPELITPNIEGLLVDPTKGQELTNALRTVILNQELRVQYGKLAKLKYDKNFEKNSISKKFLSIFLI